MQDKINSRLSRVDQIVAWRICMGCGACAWVCPVKAISLNDIIDKGIRPLVNEQICIHCGKCVKVCPGSFLVRIAFPQGTIKKLESGWGPVLQLWEGYAADNEIRYKASSGGIATAIAMWALQKGRFSGVLHIASDSNNCTKNIPTFSKTSLDLLKTIGSRYAPAAPCQSFDSIKNSGGPCLFIGKPCDCAALRKACAIDLDLKAKVGMVVSIFCAGTPTTAGTLALLDKMGIDKQVKIKSLRYRGFGWPGKVTAIIENKYSSSEKSLKETIRMNYDKAWGDILSKYGQLRCRLCPDKTGEYADIAIGDPWYRDTDDDPGRSLILIRSVIGEKFWYNLCNSMYVKSEPVDWYRLPQAQKSIYKGRCSLYGRLIVFKILNLPRPVYIGFSIREEWKKITLIRKIRSIYGTFRRIIQRKWYLREFLE